MSHDFTASWARMINVNARFSSKIKARSSQINHDRTLWFPVCFSSKFRSFILFVARCSLQPPCWHRVRKSHRLQQPPSEVKLPTLFLGAETHTNKTEKKKQKNAQENFFRAQIEKKTKI
jgi:hypothetical protein